MRINFLGLVYLVTGIAIAASHEYFKNFDTVKRVISPFWRFSSGRSCSSASTCTSTCPLLIGIFGTNDRLDRAPAARSVPGRP
jgi:hypothetical protein